MPIARFAAPTVVAVAALTVASCGKSDRATDCERLLPAVRDKSSEVRAILSAAQPDAAIMDAKAKLLEEGAANLAALPLKDSTAKGYATSYQAMLLSGAKLVRDLGNVSPDPVAMATATRVQASSASYLIDEAKMLATISEYCR
jgi:hypothetical protein